MALLHRTPTDGDKTSSRRNSLVERDLEIHGTEFARLASRMQLL
jgi:hypothetical protein